MKFIVIFFAVYSLYSCTFVFYTDKQHPKLPSLWDKYQGNIEYVDLYTREKAKITTFWAQEAVFAPEARELLQDMERQGFRFNVSAVGVADYGFFQEGMEKTRVDATLLSTCQACKRLKYGSDHGTQVSNLITGKAPVGVSSRGKITMIRDLSEYIEDFGGGIERLHTDALKISNPPPVLNASVDPLHGLSDSIVEEKHIKTANRLLDKTIFVTSSGNDFTFPTLFNGEKFIERLGHKMLVVGSLDPSGFVSIFSQEHKHVTVLAPSDHFIRSRGHEGWLDKFGGTSGSSPLVSGAVADLRSIIPDLTRDEVATIITKTATLTSINTVSKLDGHGTLNQYKMLRVGQRLAENGWPNDRANLITDAKTYDFADEAKKLADKAEALLKTGNEADYEAGFKKLRTAFALDTSNSKTRTLLANIYRDAGYTVQAMFYDNPAQSAKQASTIKKIARRASLYWPRVFEENFLKSTDFYSVVKPLNVETDNSKWRRSISALSDMEESGIQLGAGYTSSDLYAAKNLTTRQQLLIFIEMLSYGDHENVEQLLNLLIEYARKDYPELMTEPAVQKAIAKHKLTASSRLKHQIRSFAGHIDKYSMRSKEALEREAGKDWLHGLDKALQEVDRQPDLMRNDPVMAKYAKQKGVSVADLWQTLRKLVKLAP